MTECNLPSSTSVQSNFEKLATVILIILCAFGRNINYEIIIFLFELCYLCNMTQVYKLLPVIKYFETGDNVVIFFCWRSYICFSGMALEIFQFWAIRMKYLEPNNVLDWFTYISTILVVMTHTQCGVRLVR